jgi:inhibitor of KinA
MESLQSLGDKAALAVCRDERAALRWAEAVRRLAPSWLVDVVQAYTTVAVYFDLDKITFAEAAPVLRGLVVSENATEDADQEKHHVLPCCYEMQLDLERVARHVGLSPAEVVRLHSATEYTIYAIGFSPGFPYLGYLPPPLCGVPRLETPRLRVEPGSVGLTGRQTGVYPEARPGGWNLIGRTPLTLVDVADGHFPMHTGDRVRFEPIDTAEFERLLGRRL